MSDVYELYDNDYFRFHGAGGNDDLIVFSSGGVGYAFGGSGDDHIGVEESRYTYVDGGSGNDEIANDSRYGDFVCKAGSGSDWVRLGSARFFNVDLGSGDDTLDNEMSFGRSGTIHGGTGHDTIYGTPARDVIHGDAGNDLIITIGDFSSKAKQDILYGGNGNDTIDSNDPWSICVGGAGNDFIKGGKIVIAGAGDDIISAYIVGNERVNAGSGNDLISNVTWADAGTGLDTITATTSEDHFWLGRDGARDEVREQFFAGGLDVISQFEDNIDQVVIKQAGLSSISQIAISDTVLNNHSGALLSFNGGSILLVGLSANQINPADILIVT